MNQTGVAHGVRAEGFNWHPSPVWAQLSGLCVLIICLGQDFSVEDGFHPHATWDICHCLETFLVVIGWGEGMSYWHLVGRGHGCC